MTRLGGFSFCVRRSRVQWYKTTQSPHILKIEVKNMKRCNGVFAGGGVRGIAHLGAVCELERRGYRWERLAGSSAGAIVAALVAAGYTGREAKEAMLATDYPAFKEKDLLDNLGIPGKALSLFWKFGIYSTDHFERWMQELLAAKKTVKFGDIRRGESYRLQVTASDLTDRRLLVFPDDLSGFGIDSDTFPIAKAVRMSMSIPIFFEPYRLRDSGGKEHLIVDGGLLSNYPMWIMDNAKGIPTLGFQFTENQAQKTVCGNCGGTDFIDYIKAMVSTVLDARDHAPTSSPGKSLQKTVWISPEISVNGGMRRISSTDFAITRQEQLLLYENGRRAAAKFCRSYSI